MDGNRDQDGTYGSCAWAHNDDDVFKTWWNVDLEASYYIHSLEIFFRTDGKLFRFSKVMRACARVCVYVCVCGVCSHFIFSIFKDGLPYLFHSFRNKYFNKISLGNLLYFQNKL